METTGDRQAEIVQVDGGWQLRFVRTFETIAQAAAVIEAAESAEWGDDVRVELTTPPEPTKIHWRVGGTYRSRNGYLRVTIIDTSGRASHFGTPQPIVGRDQYGQVRSWSENGSYFGTGCESTNDLMPGEITDSGDVTPPEPAEAWDGKWRVGDRGPLVGGGQYEITRIAKCGGWPIKGRTDLNDAAVSWTFNGVYCSKLQPGSGDLLPPTVRGPAE